MVMALLHILTVLTLASIRTLHSSFKAFTIPLLAVRLIAFTSFWMSFSILVNFVFKCVNISAQSLSDGCFPLLQEVFIIFTSRTLTSWPTHSLICPTHAVSLHATLATIASFPLSDYRLVSFLLKKLLLRNSALYDFICPLFNKLVIFFELFGLLLLTEPCDQSRLLGLILNGLFLSGLPLPLPRILRWQVWNFKSTFIVPVCVLVLAWLDFDLIN